MILIKWIILSFVGVKNYGPRVSNDLAASLTLSTCSVIFLLQVLNVFSVTLSAKQKTCLSAICKSTWLQGCLNVMCATSSWRLLSNCWSTRNATLSPPVGSSKESKYTSFYCVKYLKYCGDRNREPRVRVGFISVWGARTRNVYCEDWIFH